MASTGFVPPAICWLSYIAICGCVIAFFFAPQHPDPWVNGFIADIAATVVCFVFSFLWRNTSIYDPYWVVVPPVIAAGWMATADSAPSARSWYAFGLLFVWFFRYNYMWIWDGWTHGIKTEDWRYIVMAKKLGSGTSMTYWIGASFIGSHIVPTLLVWFAMAPVQRVWSAGSAAAPLGGWDAAGCAVALGAVALQGVSDRQLKGFRQRNIKGGLKDETCVCPKTCREGVWGWSRHPNYCGEASFWLGMALVAHAGDPSGEVPWAWAWGGAANMFFFFRTSAALMDARSLRNRPGYEVVMKEVSALLPLPLVRFVDRVLDPVLVPLFGFRKDA